MLTGCLLAVVFFFFLLLMTPSPRNQLLDKLPPCCLWTLQKLDKNGWPQSVADTAYDIVHDHMLLTAWRLPVRAEDN